MLDERRIREAERNVKAYLEEGLLRKTDFNEIIFNTLLKNSKESLEIANMLFNSGKSYLWTIVTSYYAMYYIANAILYKLGYKIGHRITHKITADCLIVFVRNKLARQFLEDFENAQQEALEIAKVKADFLIKDFEYERKKRTTFQYEYTEEAKRNKAKTSLERAKRFVFEMEKLLV